MSSAPSNRTAQPTPAQARSQAASAGRWSVVVENSEARFHVRDKLVTTVHGSMPIEAGTVVVADDGTVTDAWISLSAPGIATGNSHRDRDLRKPRFLDAAAFPSVRVEVEAATSTPTGCTARAGVLARGMRAPLDLTAETVAEAGAEVRIRVSGRLDRLPLGIKAPTFVIGRYLDLEADLTLRRQPPERATPLGGQART
ncbi:MAG: YceI family protein [Kineosporiaceae bacterium]